jgi:hypothetical protein
MNIMSVHLTRFVRLLVRRFDFFAKTPSVICSALIEERYDGRDAFATFPRACGRKTARKRDRKKA